MRFDTSQHMKMGQQMKLAPRMIQSMEILQMALPALEERIEQELESNIALETWEPGADTQTIELERAERDRADRENERELTVEDGGAGDFERLGSMEADNPEAFDNEYSAASLHARQSLEPGSYSPSRMAGERDAKMDALANTAAPAKSLTDQLLEQWSFAEVDGATREAGRLLIQNIDDDGYIRADLEQIRESIADEGARPSLEALERALTALQIFLDPPGLAARDLRESLLLQLDAIEEADPRADVSAIRKIIESHLDDLTHNRIPRIAEKTGMSIEEISEALAHVPRLVLHPGRTLVNSMLPSIIPDAIVEYDEDGDDYIAYLTDGRMPNLRINKDYATLVKDRGLAKQDREFIRTNLSNANWLIDALNQRRHTLQRVLNAVVAAQRDFFDLGEQALKPLPMTQVADQLGIHVATVSRAVAGKHIQCPRGIFPLRRFFTGGMQTQGGDEVSYDAIKAALRDVIDEEDKSNPHSDDALVKELEKKGIDIARRTVAKYRSQLDIPSARLRKKF